MAPSSALAASALLIGACGGVDTSPTQARTDSSAQTGVPLLASLVLPQVEFAGSEPDGEDDARPPQPPAALRDAPALQFVPLERPTATTPPVVCDLVGFRNALVASFAVNVIDASGAQVYRYQPNGEVGARWSLVLDYAGGQGLPRVRVIDDRLHIVDADSTSRGFFGLSDAVFEAYVFVSDEHGQLSDARPDRQPPDRTKCIAGSLHSFDVIRYRGALVATGGTGIFAGDDPWWSRDEVWWPGALFVGRRDADILEPRFPLGRGVGVVRTTFAHRFGGRLYIGFQNNGGRGRFDLAVLSGDPLAADTPPPVLARVTPDGGWVTRRFASGDGSLYWIASGYGRRRDRRPATLFRSKDGRAFEPVPLPPDAGEPQDLIVWTNLRVLLTRRGLYRSIGDGPFRRVAAAPAGDPFGAFELFCSAPLAVVGDRLYAGSTRDGRVYALVTAVGASR